jgi:hypothetical protein
LNDGNITQADESYTKTTVGNNSQSTAKSVKVLGTSWNTKTDEFQFELDELITFAKLLPLTKRLLPLTKRSFLKVSAKIFDPLGVLSPFTIVLKCCFQSMCVKGFDWDDELQEPYKKIWISLMTDLLCLQRICIPQCYFNTSMKHTNTQFHSFSDASKNVYAAVIYLRSIYEYGHIETLLVDAKTRVAPVKAQTIPRLELLSAVISARLSNSISRCLPVNDAIKFTYWTDSMMTLQWIQNELGIQG